MRIRSMAMADLGPVMGLASQLAEAPHWPRPAYEAALQPSAQPARVALVAEAPGERLMGFAVASLLSPESELESIAVAVEFQRRGVARALVAALIDALRAQGAAEVLLEVRASNHPAKALYRAVGFQERGRRVHYYVDPVEDAVLMGKKICRTA